MPLFLSEDEYERCSHDASLVAEKADAFIRERHNQLKTVKAQADVAAIKEEQTLQTCSLLGQKYFSFTSDLANLSLKHQIHLKSIEKDGEIERLSTEASELHPSRRQVNAMLEQKDLRISEKSAVMKSYLDKMDDADLKERLEKCEAEVETNRKAHELNLIPLSNYTAEAWVDSDRGNDMVDYSRTVVPNIPVGISGTALAASLLRDGCSLTKMYAKNQEVVDALQHEQLGRKHSQAILEQVEDVRLDGDIPDADIVEVEPPIEVVKRKVGRPRKFQLSLKVTIKRKPGRPRKQPPPPPLTPQQTSAPIETRAIEVKGLRVHVQTLRCELSKYKELSGKSLAEVDSLRARSKELEVMGLAQTRYIETLQSQLAVAEKRLEMPVLETRTKFEEQRRLIEEIQSRLAESEVKIIEGDNLRKKLHNTILELKGNIRVFCRVRPLLREDGVGAEPEVFSYPTSVEKLGRGIDLFQNGQKHSFTFDRVSIPEALHEEVFVEIAQLVQSAIDGYKDNGVEITANSLHPGAIATNLFRHYRLVSDLVDVVGKYVMKNVQQGAATTCYVALHPQVKGMSGKYFADCKSAEASSQANDTQLAKQLRDFSLELINKCACVSQTTG